MAAQAFTRRTALKLAGGAALAATSISALGHEASAGRAWCYRDPVFKINGDVVDVLVGAPNDINGVANGPTRIVLTVPTGSTAELLATDAGFGGWGYDVRIATSDKLAGHQVKVEVYQPVRSGTWPVQVRFVSRSADYPETIVASSANKWITVIVG